MDRKAEQGAAAQGSGSNRMFAAKDVEFAGCCALGNARPTKRQASKFRMGRGLAYAAAADFRAYAALAVVLDEAAK